MDEMELMEEMLKKVEDVLYQEGKYSDKNIAEMIIELLESEYDIR